MMARVVTRTSTPLPDGEARFTDHDASRGCLVPPRGGGHVAPGSDGAQQAPRGSRVWYIATPAAGSAAAQPVS
jgi:hypothetical protein